jgi:hypothetical protein
MFYGNVIDWCAIAFQYHHALLLILNLYGMVGS